MAEENLYRKVGTLDLYPVIYSLGVPADAFKEDGVPSLKRQFDAAIPCGVDKPGSIYLFRRETVHTFDLTTGQLKASALIATEFGSSTSWPHTFSSSLDSAVWAGPQFPNLFYFFQGSSVMRLMKDDGQWLVDESPAPLLAAWRSAATNAAFSNGWDVALHAIGNDLSGRLHVFKDNMYMRHNLNDGTADVSQVPIAEAWNLPAPFSEHLDVAFYGVGDQSETIFFVSGMQVAEYDLEAKATVRVRALAEKFPGLAQFAVRAQLFLVERYTLETYVGPSRLGKLVDTVNLPPDNTTTRLLVTETVNESTTTHQQSILESQDKGAVDSFNSEMQNRSSSGSDQEAYSYHLAASAHADASANSLWGGEVNASLNAQGGTDSLRTSFAKEVAGTVGTQVSNSVRQVNQTTYASTGEIAHKERVLRQEQVTMANDSGALRVYEFYQQLQPYITLLILDNVRVRYIAAGEPVRTVELVEIDKLLADVLISPDAATALKQRLRADLSSVVNSEGGAESVLAPSGNLEVPSDRELAVDIRLDDGTTQTLKARGVIIKDRRSWEAPTLSMRAVVKSGS